MAFLIFLLLLPIACCCDLITVGTSRGSVQGFDQDLGDDKSQRFYGYGQIFLGIPFAKPPLGERRFTLPEDICQYNDRGEVHNATYFRPRCWQVNHPPDQLSEDCLYLNVMTPNISGNYPVMVYVHGGSFTTGGADTFHWKGAIRNLLSRGVVVVTIQYRIGLIGFFTTFTETFPPNRGLFDQILALRWVNEEIANFGGDSNRITLFGQSAGAASVSDLSLSPLARGLFHQVIQESGSALIDIETITDPRGSIHQDRAKQLCQIDSSNWGSLDKDQTILSCLLQASPQDLIANDDPDVQHWNAAIDGAVLPDTPENLAKSRPKYPTLIGDMLEDFSAFVPGVKEEDVSNVTQWTNLEMLQDAWPNYDNATAKNINDIMIAGFSNGLIPAADDHLGWAKLVTDMNTGWYYSSFSVRDAQWHRAAGNEQLWLFTFAYRSLLPYNIQIEDWIPIVHCSERPYLWYFPYIWETYNASDSDFAVAEYMGELWTDFAKNGELSFPKAGAEMNFIEIGDVLQSTANWRSTANKVFNEQMVAYLGEFPPLSISDDSWAKLKDLGEKVVSKWNSMQGSCKVPPPPVQCTTKGSLNALASLLPATFILISLSLRARG